VNLHLIEINLHLMEIDLRYTLIILHCSLIHLHIGLIYLHHILKGLPCCFEYLQRSLNCLLYFHLWFNWFFNTLYWFDFAKIWYFVPWFESVNNAHYILSFSLISSQFALHRFLYCYLSLYLVVIFYSTYLFIFKSHFLFVSFILGRGLGYCDIAGRYAK